MSATIPISKTKIVIPHRRPEILSRTRLLEKFQASLERKLILLSAPAGFGKTSLLVDLAHFTNLPVCWLSLDPLDRDPQRFLAYFVAALAERFPRIKEPVQSLLNNLKSIETDVEPLLVTLTNELYDQVEEDFLFIMDDFHLLDDLPVISALLNRFLQLVDDNCHVVVASRRLPDLPDFTLMVAREQVEGLSQTDLAFQPREIQALFNQNYNRHLTEQNAQQLVEQTDGWITGIILSDLSGTPQASRVDAFTYFGRQVLDQQPEHLREILLRTSLPDEFNAELCEAVLGPFHRGPQNWSAIMSLILDKNLFVLPVGDDGRWLRYHPLFREFLESRLRVERPSEIRPIVEQLTHFYEESGEWEKTYYTCQQLNDSEMLAEVVEHAGTYMLQHALTTLENWVNGLPPNLVAGRPGLVSLRGGIATTKGNLQGAVLLLNEAETAYRKEGDIAGLTLTLVRRASTYRQLGKYQDSLRDTEDALQFAETRSDLQPLYAEALRNKGINLYRLGRSRQAVEFLERSLSLYTALKDTGSIPFLLTETGIVHGAIGDVGSAKDAYLKALNIWQSENNFRSQAEVLNSLAVLYHQLGDYERASEVFEEGLLLARKSHYQRAEALILIGMGDLYAEVDEFESAAQAYEKAAPLIDQLSGYFIDTYLILAKANLAVLQGDVPQAYLILKGSSRKLLSNPSLYERGLRTLIEGRIHLLEKHSKKAVTSLQECKECFTQDGRDLESQWSRVWLAVALEEVGQGELARAEIRELLNLRGGPAHTVLVALRQAASWLKPLQKDPQIGPNLSGLLEKTKRLDARFPVIRRSLRRMAQSIQMPAASLIIRAFGRAEVLVDGQVVPMSKWSAQSVRDLFFFFLYKDSVVTKEQVAATIWPDLDDPQTIKQRFKTYIFRLRRATRRDVIIFDEEYYRFNHNLDYEYDVEAFETYLARARAAREIPERINLYEKAAALVKGPYLSGVDMPWALGERERLEQVHLDALEKLVTLYLQTDRLGQALSTGQSALTSDPYRETIHQLLMRIYAAMGDRTAIRRQYDACKTALKELGLSPSLETDNLYRDLTA